MPPLATSGVKKTPTPGKPRSRTSSKKAPPAAKPKKPAAKKPTTSVKQPPPTLVLESVVVEDTTPAASAKTAKGRTAGRAAASNKRKRVGKPEAEKPNKKKVVVATASVDAELAVSVVLPVGFQPIKPSPTDPTPFDPLLQLHHTVPSGHLRRVQQFYREGLCQLKQGLTKTQVQLCRREVYQMFDHTMNVIKRLDLHDDLASKGFQSFKMRHAGRYDMEIKDFDRPSFNFLRGDAPWLPLVKGILGEDARLCNTGVMLSLPGSAVQPWHSDGDHLSKRAHLSPYCVNVFVPLCNITEANGGTEMIPKTHIFGDYDAANKSTTIQADAGQCILFDFRLKHRGLANNSKKPRPLMYITYCIPSWKDGMNFNTRRYLKLPELDGPASSSTRGDDSYIDPNESDDDREEEGIKEGPSKEEVDKQKIRAARIKHRDLAANCVRKRGIAMYVNAPVLARDNAFGWFPAQIVKVNDVKGTLKIHYNGWHKRFDFNCPFDSDRIKPMKLELLATGVSTVIEK